MGFFFKKSKGTETINPAFIAISGEQLKNILWYLVRETQRRYLDGSLIVSQEVLFDYNDETYIAGIRYDKKAAKSAGETDFNRKYMSVYMDGRPKQFYMDPDSFYESASLKGVPVKTIETGIYVAKDEFGDHIGA